MRKNTGLPSPDAAPLGRPLPATAAPLHPASNPTENIGMGSIVGQAILFSCPGCRSSLRLPAEAAGRRARCGRCKEVVRVPLAEAPPQAPSRPTNLEDELGDFLSEMISSERDPDETDGFARPKRYERPAQRYESDDVEDDLDDVDDAVDLALGHGKRPEPAPSPARAPLGAQAKGALGSGAPAKKTPSAATPAPTTAAKAAPAASPSAASALAGSPKPVATEAPVKAAPVSPAPGKVSPPVPEGFPSLAQGPFLEVRSISALGVRLVFPAAQLKDKVFRGSFPAVCVFSGEPIGKGSYARPMVFNNHHAEGDELVRMVELRHEKTILSAYSGQAFVEETPIMKELPSPFDLAIPYPVTAGHHESSLECRAHVSGRHDGYCEVVIPSPEAALAWVARVNGICHPSHTRLLEKGSRVSSEAWTRLPQATRDRIGMWCTFRRGERFKSYARDSHSTPKDAGLGGILITDQRLVFHLYRTTWSVDLSKPLKIFSRVRGETFGLAVQTGNEEMRPMCSVLRGDAALLFESLDEAAADLKVIHEDENLTAAA